MQYVTNFKKKAELLNSVFTKQCSIIQNSSKRALTLSKKPEKSILSIAFNCMIFQQLFVALILAKFMISIRILKICGKPICKPLELTLHSCIKHEKFPNKWKMAKVAPVHKKVISRF